MILRYENKWKHLGTVVACGLALVAGREFYLQETAPLRAQAAKILREVAELSGQIDAAHKAIAEVHAEKKDTEASRSAGERLHDGCPAGPPMVWVPALIKDHFARSGTAVLITRFITIQDEPNLPGQERGFWSTALAIGEAGRNITPVIHGIADLEQQHPYVRVLDFAIRTDPENPGQRVALFNLTALIPK